MAIRRNNTLWHCYHTQQEEARGHIVDSIPPKEFAGIILRGHYVRFNSKWYEIYQWGDHSESSQLERIDFAF